MLEEGYIKLSPEEMMMVSWLVIAQVDEGRP